MARKSKAKKPHKVRLSHPAKSRTIKKIRLPSTAVAQVILPKDHAPIVTTVGDVVEIAPVKVEHVKSRSWVDFLFSTEKNRV